MKSNTFNIILWLLILTNIIYSQSIDWELLGLEDKIIYDIAIDDSNNIYIALEPGALFKSSDNGNTWLQKNNGIAATTGMALDIDSQGSIYLAALGGVFKTTNGGENWFRIAQTLTDLEFVEIKIIHNDYIFVSNLNGIHRSTDYGQSWGSTDYTFWGAGEIGINKNQILFAGNVTATYFSIYRSTNLGENWTLSTTLPTQAFIFPNNGDIFAGVDKTQYNSGGIFQSTDDGVSWIRNNAFPDSFSVHYSDMELDRNGDFYLAVGGSPLYSGVHISTDSGMSWINYNFSLSTDCLAIDSSGYIYAGTNQQGLFRTAGRTIPVELISFKAEINDCNVLLKWSTASEINNLGFEIQRKQGNENWTKIGFIEGNGTSTRIQNYNYSDNNLNLGKYFYRLKQIDYNGGFEYSNEIEIFFNKPYKFNLEQNFPNPFNPETIIKFSIPYKGLVSLILYNSLGEIIKVLINDYLTAGIHSFKLEFDSRFKSLSSGVYFYSIQFDNYTQTKKMLLIR